MYRKVITASTFLLLTNFMTTPVFAQETAEESTVTEVIGVLYTQPTCQTCDSVYADITEITKDTIYTVDLRDTSTSPKLEEEYDEATTICGIGKGVYPMLITSESCYTDSQEILAKVEKVVADATFFAQREDVPDESESEVEDTIPLSEYLNGEKGRPEMDPLILIAILVIPGILIWGANYLIKNYKL